MNEYATMARRHWEQWLPERYAQISDPDSFFSSLGQQAAEQIAELMLDLAGDDPPGEDYLTKLGRLNAARDQAREIVLREILPEPEPDTDNQPAEPASPPPAPATRANPATGDAASQS